MEFSLKVRRDFLLRGWGATPAGHPAGKATVAVRDDGRRQRPATVAGMEG